MALAQDTSSSTDHVAPLGLLVVMNSKPFAVPVAANCTGYLKFR